MVEFKKRVLIVDDDVDICANFQDILKELGYETEIACDGPSALALVRKYRFDVALLDFKMPGMNGEALYREIKKLRPEIVAIMVTAYAGGGGAQEALDAGTWDVLSKPVDVRLLLDKLEAASRARTILVVDDDTDFCQTLWQLLTEQRYRVAIAHSESDGIEQASDVCYDVALIDLHLGDGDGRNVLKQISLANPDARKVVVTGYQDGAPETLTELGIEAVFCKPIEISELLAQIGEQS